MKKLIAAMLLALPLFAVPTVASAANVKMKACNADAKAQNLAGPDRKAFMKQCLKKDGAAPSGQSAQRSKMKACNADAKSQALKGPDRKAFMSQCLKG